MMTQEPYYTKLNNRGQIKISGKDARRFLQSLVTNDIDLLNVQDCVYTCLLTPQGKFQFDFFITQDKDSETLVLDCEGGARATELEKILKMYALRAEITFETQVDIPIYAIIGQKLGVKDPRHNDIGYRSNTVPASITEQPFDVWDVLRITLCIPDGSRDMVPGKSLLLDHNIEGLNGISYTKGCYVGQEITARMHYRGLTKKELVMVTSDMLNLNQLPTCGEPIIINDKTSGEMRSSCGSVGLALMKKSAIVSFT